MGWCSGTILFDKIVGGLLGEGDIKETIKMVITELENMDWD